MKFVHDCGINWGVGSVSEREIGQDFLSTANDGRIRIDRCVSRDHSDVVRTGLLTKREKLFRNQGFDWGGVPATLSVGDGFEVGRGCD